MGVLPVIIGLVVLYFVIKDISQKGAKSDTAKLIKKAKSELDRLRSDTQR